MKKFKEFNFWFVPVGNGKFEVVNRLDGSSAIKSEEEIELGSEASEFNQFKSFPEYRVGKACSHSVHDRTTMQRCYETLFLGVLRIRKFKSGGDPDDCCTEKALSWLNSTDFFSAPASTQYHGAYPGGLVEHTLDAYNELLGLLNCPKFQSVPLHSGVLCILVHDWCKIDYYEAYQKNVKDESGKWTSVTGYKVNQRGVSLGHGVTSMFLASKVVNLAVQEAEAIRWHMSAWRVVDSEMSELQRANESYPIVHLVQFADQLSIVNY